MSEERQTECAVDVSTRLLSSITDAALDHLSLGMTHNFGATITRPKELGGELLIIETEDGARMGIAAGCTEMDAWKIAEAAFHADGVPAHLAGVLNMLPKPCGHCGHCGHCGSKPKIGRNGDGYYVACLDPTCRQRRQPQTSCHKTRQGAIDEWNEESV